MRNNYFKNLKGQPFMVLNLSLKVLLRLFIAFTISLFLTLQLSASYCNDEQFKPNNETVDQKSQEAQTGTMIYSDSLIRIYYSVIVCENLNSILLTFENLTDKNLNISYKIWVDSEHAKTMILPPYRTIEGICDSVYNNYLVEQIPVGSSIENISVLINYLP